MKRFVILILLFTAGFTISVAQVGINTDGTSPDPSAGLEVKFIDKGFLLPRLNTSQRDAISSPAEGLMVFCTDCGTNGSLSIYSKRNLANFLTLFLPGAHGRNEPGYNRPGCVDMECRGGRFRV